MAHKILSPSKESTHEQIQSESDNYLLFFDNHCIVYKEFLILG